MKALSAVHKATGLLMLGLLSACITETRTELATGSGTVPITRTEPERAWLLEENGESRGYVVLFSDPERAEDTRRQYFSVRNHLHQELGTIDALGRAWRFVPHEREAAMLGAGTVVGGAQQILGAGPGAVLVEVSVQELRNPGLARATDATVKSLPEETPRTAQEPHPRP